MRISLSFDQAKQRTDEEIKALPKFSRQSAEKAYRLTDSIYIDNVHGIGQTPDNRSVMYKGFVANLSLDTFKRLAKPSTDDHERAEPLIEKIRDGYGIGSPCLYIDVDSFIHDTSELPQVTGHEGRARCTALQQLGVTTMPIQFLISGYRARHIKSVTDFHAYLNAGLVAETGVTYRNLFHQLYFA